MGSKVTNKGKDNMARKPKVNELSPDGYSRFFIMADVLEQIYGKKRTIRILDVGGGSEFFGQQLKRVGLLYDLTILDMIERPPNVKERYIQDDATNMQLKDSSYDVVVSTDTLEHIPEKAKQAFLNECLRVAKDVCIVAAPFNTRGVNDAEIAVNEFNKKLFGKGQDWLEEHLKYGKPNISLLTNTLARRCIQYDDFGTQNITTWLLNTHINLIDAKLGLDLAAHTKTNLLYSQNILHMNEFQEPTYRHFFVIYKDGSKQARLDIKRYTAAAVDEQKVASYISALAQLLSERISRLNVQNEQLMQELLNARGQIETAQSQYDRLSKTAQKQAETLKKLAPVIKVAKIKPIKGTYALLRKMKGER